MTPVQKGRECLRLLNPNYVEEPWYYDKVGSLREIPNFSFYSKESCEDQVEDFDPIEIWGTTHEGYTGSKWISMLGGLNRGIGEMTVMSSSRREEHINSPDEYELLKYGNRIIMKGGNHRLCVAKFLGIRLKNVEMKIYKFNQVEFDLVSWFEERNIKITHRNSDNWSLILANRKIEIVYSILEDFKSVYENCQQEIPPRMDRLRSAWNKVDSQITKFNGHIKARKDFEQEGFIESILSHKQFVDPRNVVGPLH